LTAVLLLSLNCFAFQSPLSPESVREAYFLGQHRDEGMAHFLDKYTRHLPFPEAGPYISSITLFTPFALLVQDSSQRSDYSSQQSAVDHSHQTESVKVIVEIVLTATYGPFIPRPTGSKSGSPIGIAVRPGNFWRDFDVRVFSGDKQVMPIHSSGRPYFRCSGYGCILTGAAIELEFDAEAFSLDSATVQVSPPEGDQVPAEFNLVALK
jgi:hypothetical protein